MIAHPQLAADLHLAQRPADEGPDRADRDQLPKPAVAQGGEGQPVLHGGGSIEISQGFQTPSIAVP